MNTKTYQVWNGEYWTFERIVESLSRLVRSIVARTTPEECPEECIGDCMQDAWLRLYERLEADPQALGPDPASKSPAHTRSYYANRVVWDAHKGSGFGLSISHASPSSSAGRLASIASTAARRLGRSSSARHARSGSVSS